MEDEQIIILLQKYKTGSLTPREKEILESWYIHQAASSNNEISADNLERNLATIAGHLPLKKQVSRIRKLWPRLTTAASILLVAGIGLYFYANIPSSSSGQSDIAFKNDIKPGGNKAYLTLANGKKISITDASNGMLIKQAGVQITKTNDGKLVYTVAGDNSTSAQYNTIETPNGGEHQIVLQDGTKVWLNAASSLKYPTTFAKTGQRKVELTGEAYFEVAKDKVHPFIVKTDKQEIQVLGTHFNVNSYADEPATKTALIEGSVKVTNLSGAVVVIKPGQQSVNTGTGMEVKPVDIEKTLAWKNGDFFFRDDDFRAIMRKVARWYDVDVVYSPSAPYDLELGGWLPRSENISAILKLMELTGRVHFKIEGRRITVTE